MKIKDLGSIQKIIREALNYPMKWSTAKEFENFLKRITKAREEATLKINFQERHKIISDKLQEEFDKKFEDDKSKYDNMISEEDKKDTEKYTKKLTEIITKEIRESSAGAEEKKLLEEFNECEVDIEPLVYVIDETLPAIFNIFMRDDNSGLIKFRERAAKKI